MQEITAQLNSYRQSPRKVRIVADVLRGKSVSEAKKKLDFITKRATGPLHKLLDSAIANAKDLGAVVENLKVKAITVDGGKILYRRRSVSHGSAHTIHKRTSHIKITLIEKAPAK
ncbi:MAG: 50S ribosomal protein L22 [Candidatus Zambryskibacteria bacterium RIFOXYC1_FULL_39_10]|uniref:Large ribosomal subunit protein uL22 n=1 Tax=Candidatus Zambryskibacteria bacterium RIFOXYC1_FULL_39_10 TaxID=1802779 RepID=A0A1G2V423_9BACT|nr:MAG: 50S ribosomal protein L22 [Candidatus Zambryskibacteria bacterium RIFOXYD1_FULL_39_35]OHB16374.1 MAG: 50S ribosomal protein L22 [Candidatus Zambryskibacteria bacterium RIFOXYC1_FULL_39_10]